jgi:dTDP-4-amino-4,6-dideoxygalactose transaminase
MSFNKIKEFEGKIAEFFGAPYAVAVDCCTHGIELSLRYSNSKKINVPKRTYISVPFLANKLGLELEWRDEDWVDYYHVCPGIIDAAVLWKKDSYVPGTLMSVSFQFRKHLSLGRGGIILTDDKVAAEELKKMMTPETAQLGLDKLDEAINTPPHQWTVDDWPDLTKMDVFNKK